MFLPSDIAQACSTLIIVVLKALVVYLIGKELIKWICGKAEKLPKINGLDPTVRSFTLNAIRYGLYVLLLISIIGILGIPMSSVIAVLASAGVAVGLAMRGSLSNLAGGLMLMIFRPFNIGDYISAGGAEGVVQEISLFYTVIKTVDNKRITVPNGNLMNANVTNFSAEATRRVDLTFNVAKGEDVAKIQELLVNTAGKNEKVLKDPAPFARLSGGSNEAMEFTVRAWCDSADYWDVYFDLTQALTEALGAAGVQGPAVRVIRETK